MPEEDLQHPGRPMSSWSRAGRAALLSAAAFAAIFGAGMALAWLLNADRPVGPGSLDGRVTAWVVATRGDWPGLTLLFRAASRVGDLDIGLIVMGLTAVVLFVLARRDASRIARSDWAFLLGVMAGARALTVGLKDWVGRARPPEDLRLVVEESPSFPSGHAIMSAVFLGLLAYFGIGLLRHSAEWIRAAWGAACLAGALLVAASRVWLGVHYLSDVVAGFALGVAWAAATLAIRNRTFVRPGGATIAANLDAAPGAGIP